MPVCESLPDSTYFMMHQDLKGIMYHQAFGLCLPRSCETNPSFLNELLANASVVINEFIDGEVKTVHSFDNLTDFIPPDSSYATPSYMLTNLIRDSSQMIFRAEPPRVELYAIRKKTEPIRHAALFFFGLVLILLVAIPNSLIICARCQPKKKNKQAPKMTTSTNYTI
mmetsp:Transcript_9911/g.15010  ORF Transcript_9911/g.15010 Transcript_9911/m.15010 type:complete len:168 (+) Transcript_9911:229-732(+)